MPSVPPARASSLPGPTADRSPESTSRPVVGGVTIALAGVEAVVEALNAWRTGASLVCEHDSGAVGMTIAPEHVPVLYRFQCAQCGSRTSWFQDDGDELGPTEIDPAGSPLDEDIDLSVLPVRLQIVLLKRRARASSFAATPKAFSVRRRRR